MPLEPPSKRAHVEQRNGGSARERFLRELAQYASSDSDRDEAQPQPPSSSSIANGVASSSFSFFDEAAQQHAAAARQAHHGPDAARRVGSGLLANMHAQGEAANARATGAMRIVETYAPLSSGGFMDASAEHGNVQSIKVGDVVCRRLPQSGASHGAGKPGHAAPAPSTPHTAAVVQDAKAAAEEADAYGSPTFTAPSRSSAEAVQAALQPGSTSDPPSLLGHFRKASELSRDEQLYGRRITSDMLSAIGLVTRLDRATQSLEVCFADSTRAKLSLYAVRPAGFVERALFRRWQADPQSRPVPVIVHSSTHKATVSHDGDATTVPQASVAQSAVTAASDAAAAPGEAWWVIPHLLVRVVAPEAGPEWRQRVGVVVAVRRKENTIRLMALPAAVAEGGEDKAVVEVVGQAGVAPVVPQPGQRGLVVLGEKRGEQVEVVRREADAEGGLTGVHVRATRTAATFDLLPSELCMVYERR